jgi:hypothetical protein
VEPRSATVDFNQRRDFALNTGLDYTFVTA